MNPREMTMFIYDMLNNNGKYSRIDLSQVIEPRMDLDDNVVTFGYAGKSFKLEIEEI